MSCYVIRWAGKVTFFWNSGKGKRTWDITFFNLFRCFRSDTHGSSTPAITDSKHLCLSLSACSCDTSKLTWSRYCVHRRTDSSSGRSDGIVDLSFEAVVAVKAAVISLQKVGDMPMYLSGNFSEDRGEVTVFILEPTRLWFDLRFDLQMGETVEAEV